VNLAALCAMRVAVWGLGQEGTDVAALLRARGTEPVLVDDDPVGASSRIGPSAAGPPEVVAPGDVDWTSVEVVVRAPGVSRYRPELGAAEAVGTVVTTAMAVWLADFAGAPVLAVTGTKGKSTTAALAASILRTMGRRVELVGNIGVPVTETYARPRADAYVVEVSSYQATDVTTTPRVCVLTSLAPDHLDWHGGVEPYYRDKLHLLWAGPDGPSGSVAVNAASDEAVRRTRDHPDRLLYGPSGLVVADVDGAVYAEGERLLEPGRVRVPGRHNLWNVCGAVSGVLLLEGRLPPAEALAEAIAGFAGLPSRCQTVGEREGIAFVDDALASNPFATMASLDSFDGRELTLIAGGADRGVEMGGLAAALADRKPVPTVIVIEPGGRCLADAVAGLRAGEEVQVLTAASLEEAVSAALATTPVGGVVLFSPAQPTPPDEGGFRFRSRRFLDAAGVGAHPISGDRGGAGQ
jgi:UDP-N-acetylmuramoyl-L-alanine---L-glutamate ligase